MTQEKLWCRPAWLQGFARPRGGHVVGAMVKLRCSSCPPCGRRRDAVGDLVGGARLVAEQGTMVVYVWPSPVLGDWVGEVLYQLCRGSGMLIHDLAENRIL